MRPSHRFQPAAALDLLPGFVVGAVDEEGGAVRVCGEDFHVDLLVGNGGERVALGGADAPAGDVGGGRGFGRALREVWVGVGFEYEALFVV